MISQLSIIHNCNIYMHVFAAGMKIIIKLNMEITCDLYINVL